VFRCELHPFRSTRPTEAPTPLLDAHIGPSHAEAEPAPDPVARPKTWRHAHGFAPPIRDGRRHSDGLLSGRAPPTQYEAWRAVPCCCLGLQTPLSTRLRQSPGNAGPERAAALGTRIDRHKEATGASQPAFAWTMGCRASAPTRPSHLTRIPSARLSQHEYGPGDASARPAGSSGAEANSAPWGRPRAARLSLLLRPCQSQEQEACAGGRLDDNAEAAATRRRRETRVAGMSFDGVRSLIVALASCSLRC
jgi:hypothetical protein